MPVIEFEGLGENLIDGVRKVTEGTKALRTEITATNDALRKGAQENGQQQQKLSDTIEGTAQALTRARKEAKANEQATNSSTSAAQKNTQAVNQQGTAVKDLAKNLDTVPPAANKAAAGVNKLGSEAQKAGQRAGILGKIKGFFADIGNGVRDAAGQVGGFLSDIGNGVASALPQSQALLDVVGGLPGVLGAAASAATFLVANLGRLNTVQTMLTGVRLAVDGVLDRLTSFEGFKGLFDTKEQAKELAFAIQQAKAMDFLKEKTREVTVANAEADKQIAALESTLIDRTKADEERIKAADQLSDIELKRAKEEEQLRRDSIVLIQREINAKKGRNISDKNLSDELKDRLADEQAALAQAEAESIRIVEKAGRRKNGVIQDIADDAKAISDRELADRKRAVEELARLESELSRRNTTATQQTADPLERLQRIREANKAEVEALEEKLKLANAALGRGNQLTADQEQQLANIRIAIQEQYEKDRSALELKFATDRLALIQDEGEREREAFDIQLKAKVETLRQNGEDEIEIARFVQAERDKFRQGQVEDAISQEEALANARIDAMERGAEDEIAFERRKEELKLDVREEFTKARLEQIKNDPTRELERLLLEGVLQDIDKARGELEKNKPTLDLFDLLGLNLTKEQKQQFLADLQTIGQAVQDLALANIASQQAAVQAQIEASEQIIDDQQARRNELEQQLEEALDARAEGFANNEDAIRQEIELTKQVEAAALEDKKKALEQQKRLAQQQVKIDAAVQVSALLAANARLLEKGALSGIPGAIAAIAFGLSLIAQFAAIRAKVRAAAADTPQFRHGGAVDGLIQGSTHEQGGIAMFDRRTGREVGEMEGKEFIVNKRSYSKFPKMVEAINEGNLSKIQQAAIRELALSANVQLDPVVVKEFVKSKETERTITIVQTAETNKALLKRIDILTEAVEGFQRQERERPRTEPTGKTATTTPNRTVIKR